MTTATAPTSQSDLDYARSICLVMADDFRFAVEDVDADLLRGATEYARQYTGSFDFMREMHVAALKRAWLTEGQAKGVLNCLMADVRRCRRAEAQAAQPQVILDFTALRSLFAKAGAHLKRPRIVLQLDDGKPIMVKLATMGAHVGALNISAFEANQDEWGGTAYNRFGSVDRDWYGRVETTGLLTKSRLCTDSVVALLRELADNPVAAAKRHAHLTGNCMFCNRKLDDERSTAAGYGPICADHYGLPWGE